MKRELGFIPKYTVEDAVRDLQRAFSQGLIPESMDKSIYFNIRRMQEVNLT
jgi:hypothetical protein